MRLHAAYPDLDLVLVETLELLDLDAREAELAVRLTASPPEYLVLEDALRTLEEDSGIRLTVRLLDQLEVLRPRARCIAHAL